MAIAYVIGMTAGNESGGNLTVTKHANVADGHILVAAAYNEISATAWNAGLPAGWAQWGSGQVDSNTNMWLNLFWKRASSEGASWTFGISTTWRTISIGAFSGGIASGDPIATGPTGNKSDGVSNDVVALSITPGVANTMLICAMANYDGNDIAAGSAGYSQGAQLGGCEIWYLIQAGTGATGNKTFGANSSVNWATYHLALKEAEVATGQPAVKRMGGVEFAHRLGKGIW